MAFFGLFMIGAVAAAKLGKDIDTYKTTKRRKKRAIENGKDFYVDKNGYPVHLDSGLAYTYRWINGEQWEVDPYTGAKRRNISRENKNEFLAKTIKEAKIRGEEWYLYTSFVGGFRLHPSGERWKRFGDDRTYYIIGDPLTNQYYTEEETKLVVDIVDRKNIKNKKEVRFYNEKGRLQIYTQDELKNLNVDKLIETNIKIINEKRKKYNDPYLDYRAVSKRYFGDENGNL